MQYSLTYNNGGLVEALRNTIHEVVYFTEINSNAGTITPPAGTIAIDQFPGGIDAYVSAIAAGRITGVNPVTGAGVTVDVATFDSSGNYTLTGVPSGYPVALIYVLRVPLKDFGELDMDHVIEIYQGGGATSLSPGSVVFSNGTQLDQDNSKFYWHKGDRRLGLNTTAPQKLIDVNGESLFRGDIYVGSSAAGASGLHTYGGSPARYYINGFSGNGLSLGAGGSPDKWFLGTDGKVGINMGTSAVSMHHVKSNDAALIGGITQGAASQTANLYEWRNSSGTALAYIDKDGDFNVPKITVGAGQEVTKIHSQYVTINFPSVAADSYNDQNVAFSGAAIGDSFHVTADPGSVPNNVDYAVFVHPTLADTVVVRCLNNDSVAAADPASGNFRIVQIKF